MTMTEAKLQLKAITNEVMKCMEDCVSYANQAEELHADGPAESLRSIASELEQWVNDTRKKYCRLGKVRKDMVTVTCYGLPKQMERQEAIRFYSEGVLACDGSEKERYANILAQLVSGYMICSDGK